MPNPPMPVPDSLSPDARALMGTVAFFVDSALKKPPGSDRYSALVRKIDKALDDKLAAGATSNLACKSGCEFCCHRVILVSAPEVSAIVSAIAESFSEEARSELRERMRRYVAEVGTAQGLDLIRLRPTCPLLVGGQCSVYAHRPIACRWQCSTDAAACEAASRDGSTRFPETPAESRLGRAVSTALIQSLEANPVFSNMIDLGRAVYMMLEHGSEFSNEGSADLFQFAVPGWEKRARPVSSVPGTYPTYRQGDEPDGRIDTADLAEGLYYLYTENDAEKAIAVAPNTRPAHRLFRRLPPSVIMRAEEIGPLTARYINTCREFMAMDSDPREKFDAIQEFATLGLSFLQGDDLQILTEIGDFESSELAAKLLPDLCEPIEKPRRGGRLRVGYIGDRLDSSSSGLWATGWLRNHGPEIETFAFDLSRHQKPESDLYRNAAANFFHLPGPVPTAARFIKSQDMDVLIYPDLSSRGRPIQFSTMRLARMQCAAWGGPGTTGMPNIDCFLSGDFMEPENAQDHYRERLVRLPRTGICYPRIELKVPRYSKLDFGLDDGPLFLCVQAESKLLPQWDYIFREICESTGRPIVFFRYPYWPYWELERRLNAAGVRTIFMPVYSPETFRALLSLADVALDSFGWSGGITAIETIGAGIPTVTLPGEYRKSRHTAAFLTAANAPGLIAKDPEQYIDLAANSDRRKEATRDMTPAELYDDRSTVRALDAFLLNGLK